MFRSKFKKLAITVLSIISSASFACVMDGGAFFQTMGTMPQGTFAVAVAINQANENQTLVVSERHGQRLDMIMWQFNKQLEPHYQGETFDVSIYEISGNHFIQLTGDGETIKATAHELPSDNQTDFIVTDASVIFALANGNLSINDARELGLWQSDVKSNALDLVLNRSLNK